MGVSYLDDLGIRKDLVQDLELVPPWLESIDYPILFSGADLHERQQAGIRSEIVVLQVKRNLLGLLKLLQHLQNALVSINPHGRCRIDRKELLGFALLVHMIGIRCRLDFGFVRLLVSKASVLAS